MPVTLVVLGLVDERQRRSAPCAMCWPHFLFTASTFNRVTSGPVLQLISDKQNFSKIACNRHHRRQYYYNNEPNDLQNENALTTVDRVHEKPCELAEIFDGYREGKKRGDLEPRAREA